MGLSLKDSPPGFDPSAAATDYGSEGGWADSHDSHDDGTDYAETEQL